MFPSIQIFLRVSTFSTQIVQGTWVRIFLRLLGGLALFTIQSIKLCSIICLQYCAIVCPRLMLYSISSVTNKQNMFTGCYLSESLILTSIEPQYDKRLLLELPVQFVLSASNSFEFHHKKSNWSKTIVCRINLLSM